MTATQLAEQQIIKHMIGHPDRSDVPAQGRWPRRARKLIVCLSVLALASLVFFLVQQFFWLALPLALLCVLALN